MKSIVFVTSMLAASSSAFSVDKMRRMSNINKVTGDTSRRSLLLNGGIAAAAALVSSSRPVMAEEEIPFNVFNGLIFNYRGNGFNGLDASTLDEPSIPFLEFGARLTKGEVEFVEFLAPDGDACYVTFKSDDGKAAAPIRVGEGFPIEQHDGYSSPAFVVRALKNNNVPYKFTVPGMEKYK